MPDDTPVLHDSAKLLRWVVAQAVLAPSSHNTQPWLFRIEGERLELYADRTRALAVNDPRDRELTISCAAALRNARVAAQHAGFRLDAVLLPNGDGSDLLARATRRRGRRGSAAVRRHRGPADVSQGLRRPPGAG